MQCAMAEAQLLRKKQRVLPKLTSAEGYLHAMKPDKRRQTPPNALLPPNHLHETPSNIECPGEAPIRGADQWDHHLEECHDEQLRYFVVEPQVSSVERSAEDLNKEEDMPAPERMRREESVAQDDLATNIDPDLERLLPSRPRGFSQHAAQFSCEQQKMTLGFRPCKHSTAAPSPPFRILPHADILASAVRRPPSPSGPPRHR
jgi:hypothetical protein